MYPEIDKLSSVNHCQIQSFRLLTRYSRSRYVSECGIISCRPSNRILVKVSKIWTAFELYGLSESGQNETIVLLADSIIYDYAISNVCYTTCAF